MFPVEHFKFPFKRITSQENEFFKWLKSLFTPKKRKKTDFFVTEGFKVLKDYFLYGKYHSIEWLIFNEKVLNTKKAKELVSFAQKFSVKLIILSSKLYEKLVPLESPQGVLGVFKVENFTYDSLNYENPVLILDSVQEPSNVGAILRCAVAAGASAVFYLKGTADPFSFKAVKASCGGIFSIPVLEIRSPKEVIEFLKSKNYTTVATEVKANTSIFQERLSLKTALIIGSEGRGISKEVLKLVDKRIKLPLFGDVESLNVAVATGIFLYFLRFFNGK